MATEKQLAANRANAQHSTGPRTEAGKAAVSHSLTAKGLIILPCQEADFAEFEAGMRADLRPIGAIQEALYRRALECAWNLERCRQASVKQYKNNGPASDGLMNTNGQEHELRLERYSRESASGLYKAMQELGKLQAEQQYRAEMLAVPGQASAAPAVEQLSAVCSLAQVLKHVKQTAATAASPAYQPLGLEAEALAEDVSLEQMAHELSLYRMQAAADRLPDKVHQAAA